MLAGLLAPLRLPERVIDALETMAEAGREVGPMRSELTRAREQTEPVSYTHLTLPTNREV